MQEKTKPREKEAVPSRYSEKVRGWVKERTGEVKELGANRLAQGLMGPAITISFQAVPLMTKGGTAYHPDAYMSINAAVAGGLAIFNFAQAGRLRLAGNKEAAAAARIAGVGYSLDFLASSYSVVEKITSGHPPTLKEWGYIFVGVGASVLVSAVMSNKSKRLERKALELARIKGLEMKFDEGKANRTEMQEFMSALCENYSRLSKESNHKNTDEIASLGRRIAEISMAIEKAG